MVSFRLYVTALWNTTENDVENVIFCWQKSSAGLPA